MTLAQAEQKAIDALALLGIHDVVFARELCLDHEGMTAYVQSLGSQINYKEGGTSEDFSGVTFGEEVDAYTFTMIFEKDGVRFGLAWAYSLLVKYIAPIAILVILVMSFLTGMTLS